MNRRTFGQLMMGTTATMLVPKWLHAVPAANSGAKKVRFSFMIWPIEKQANFDRCVAIVSEAGYQGIELVGEFQPWSPERRRQALAQMHSHNLVFDSMSGLKAGFAVPDETDAFFAQFRKHLQDVKELECSQVILLAGQRVNGLPKEAQTKTAVENLKRASEIAAKESIEIVIEPIDLLENPSSFLATMTDALDIVNAVGAPNLKLLYDFYHEQRSFGNLIEKLDKNIGQLGLVHIGDVPGRHEPGTGEINYDMIYRKLAELHYDRWIAMEYFPTMDLVTSMKQARLGAEKSLEIR